MLTRFTHLLTRFKTRIEVELRPASRSSRIDDIEVLRAVAIIYVVAAHLPALVGHGYTIAAFQRSFALGHGVDLFFVISGFVITRSFLGHLGGVIPGNLYLVALPFWTRRAFRILPAAWLWIAVPLLATIFLNTSGAFGNLTLNLGDALAALFQYENYHYYACSHKIAVCADGGVPMGLFWTLSLEEQFYFAFPFAMILTPRRLLVPVLMAIAIIHVFLFTSDLGFWFRSYPFIVGVLVALAAAQPWFGRLDPRFLSNPILKGSVFLLFAMALGMVASVNFPIFHIVYYDYGLLALICGVWVFVASFGKGYLVPQGWPALLLLWIGTRSYALYLCHICVYFLTRELWHRVGVDPPAGYRYLVTALLLLILLAEATYRFVERPSRRKGRQIADQFYVKESPVLAEWKSKARNDYL